MVDLPDDIRHKTLRLTKMGPMKLCLFALKKKEKKDEQPEDKTPEFKEEVVEAAEAFEEQLHIEHSDDSEEEEEWVKPEEFLVEVDVRGFQPQNINIKLKKGVLHVDAHQKDEDGVNKMRKKIVLPDDLDLDSLKSSVYCRRSAQNQWATSHQTY